MMVRTIFPQEISIPKRLQVYIFDVNLVCVKLISYKCFKSLDHFAIIFYRNDATLFEVPII